MTGARALLDEPWLVALGWLVILSLLTTTLPALALAGWRLVRPRACALNQHRAALGAFVSAAIVGLIALPLLLVAPAVVGPAREPGGTSVTGAPTAPAPSTTPSGLPNVASAGPVANDGAALRAAARLSPTALGLVGIVWLFSAALLLGRLLHAWSAANRLRGRATLMDDGPVRQTFERLSEVIHVEGTSLAVSAEVDAPVAVGIRAPSVVVPAHLLEFMPGEGLAPIFVHELTHVARRDYAANLAQSVLEALMFHSPAIWWMGGRLREAREFCCDDVSVDVTGDSARYVEALTLVARLGTLQPARPSVGMAGPRLITRVRRLLEGEPTMSMPIIRTCLVTAAIVAVSAALPAMFSAASGQLSAQLLAAGRAGQGGAVPYGFPQRQDGSGLRILDVASTEAHVCGALEVQNTAAVGIERVRFIGILSFKAAANRPVQIMESAWVPLPLAPGATGRVNAGVVEVESAWRDGRGEHVQAFCAVREIAYVNGATWGVTPNANAILGNEALQQSRPTLPRAFVGQTHALASAGATLCVDDRGAEYSGGAQIAIREEPGRAARCTVYGQWIEVDARSGDAVADADGEFVTFDVAVDGLPSPMALTSAAGGVATLQLAGGRTLGIVPTVSVTGVVAIALHDMSTTPHRLVGTRSVRPGATVRFDEAVPGMSVRLAER